MENETITQGTIQAEQKQGIEYLSQAWFKEQERLREQGTTAEPTQAEPSRTITIQGIEPSREKEPSQEEEPLTRQEEITQAEQEPSLSFKQQEPTTQPSIKPSVEECERFIQFLNKRFSLGLREDLIVLISESDSPNTKGHFRPSKSPKSWRVQEQGKGDLAFKQQNEEPTAQKDKPIHSIVLTAHSLKDTPYETLAHETAHYINEIKGEVSPKAYTNNYHSKEFKKRAEEMGLIVEKVANYGYAFTRESPEFREMLKEFKPNEQAFKIFQALAENKGKGKKGRLLKFVCSCGCIVRSAKNEEKPLRAICGYCDTPFKIKEEGED